MDGLMLGVGVKIECLICGVGDRSKRERKGGGRSCIFQGA